MMLSLWGPAKSSNDGAHETAEEALTRP